MVEVTIVCKRKTKNTRAWVLRDCGVEAFTKWLSTFMAENGYARTRAARNGTDYSSGPAPGCAREKVVLGLRVRQEQPYCVVTVGYSTGFDAERSKKEATAKEGERILNELERMLPGGDDTPPDEHLLKMLVSEASLWDPPAWKKAVYMAIPLLVGVFAFGIGFVVVRHLVSKLMNR